ncbi:GPI mannosyltransferase 3 [Cladophialophora carrionii]|uniref:Mannosyltransferase n=1 Tax=Cladophialophora carrionii TaxID=86049 RepID=A0A1C1CDU5_9EURO|nr:GPI mannosyltransferase 3 [Cladophialophora carrionii]
MSTEQPAGIDRGVNHGAEHATLTTAKAATSTLSRPTRQPWRQMESHSVLLFLLAFRLVNALTVQTFFQPDEYFQALEPAWQWAFGNEAGAWITWEWKHHLRSAIHPAIFGICYQLADVLAAFLRRQHHPRAEVLLAAPKILQALFAALSDFYTWKLASCIYGAQSPASLTALALTVASPWQWFCSTRTFSNSLETTLTIVALYNWPWHWALPLRNREETTAAPDDHVVRSRDKSARRAESADDLTRLRRSLLCAAIAVILRPTNVLVWMTLSWYTFVWNWNGPLGEKKMFARETVICGSTILLLSAVVDRIFYHAWVFPPVNFLRVNVLQSLASFYGNNDWHYYMTQGYPLLLTTALPFTLVGLYRFWQSSNERPIEDATPAGQIGLRLLARTSLLVPAAFSLISHKEVRFIYPLLPALHIITALPVSSFFLSSPTQQSTSTQPALRRRPILLPILALNFAIAYYTSQVHNSGIISLTTYLRGEFETHYLAGQANMTIGTLMPCHSTPWRSHLQYPATSDEPGIRGWVLTCEPPLDLNQTQKQTYLDEADQFYANPATWIKKHMSRHMPLASQQPDDDGAMGVHAPLSRHHHHQHHHHYRPSGHKKKIDTLPTEVLAREREEAFWATRTGQRKPWPDYLVFFAQLEPTMQAALRGSAYAECWRGFNSQWHDDWRRVGDVVVWCLDPTLQELWAKHSNSGTRNQVAAGTAYAHGAGIAAEEEIEEGASRGQKILGRGHAKRGNLDAQKNAKKNEHKEDSVSEEGHTEPFRRVVEKPFWKHREPEAD